MKIGRRLRAVLILVCIATAFLGIAVQYLWNRAHDTMIQSNETMIRELAEKNATKVTKDHEIDRMQVKKLAANLSTLTPSQIQNSLTNIFAVGDESKELTVRVAGVAYENGKAIRYQQKGDKPVLTPLNYDHTNNLQQRSAWYRNLIDGDIGEERWLDPYYGHNSKAYILEYGVPFAGETGSKAGVVYINYTVEDLRKILSKMQLGVTGYAIIVHEQSGENEGWTIVAHPSPNALQKSVEEIYGETSPAIIKALKETKVIRSRQNGDEFWCFSTALTDMGPYRLALILDRQAMNAIAESRGLLENRKLAQLSEVQSLMITALLIGIFIISLTVLLSQQIERDSLRRSILAGAFSLICLFEVGFIWYQNLHSADLRTRGFVLSNAGTSHAALQRFLGDESPKNSFDTVGLFVQSAKFNSPYEVTLTGYLWQVKNKDTAQLEAAVTYKDPGIIFPEAETMSMTKKYENDDIVGHYFETTLRQPFDYQKYPFDYQDIWVRMWPEDFTNEKSVLLPDFVGYQQKNMEDQHILGVEKDIVLEGWGIDRTFFSFVSRDYTNDFGTRETHSSISRPELHFNIRVKRLLGGVMISHVLPISIVAVLLFGVVMIKTEDPDKIDSLGFNVGVVLAYCASLFFVLMVSHISLRDTLSTPHFVYLEGFYFVMYCQLLLVSVYDLAFVYSPQHSMIKKDNGALQKFLYWPVFMFAILAVTVVSFF